MKRKLASVGLMVLWAAVALAQGTTTRSGFDVASIKPSRPGTNGTHVGVSGGTFTAQNVTLRALILQAYELRSFQLSGGPSWLDTDMYDIVAKESGVGVSDEDLRNMTSEQRGHVKEQFVLNLRDLLADRFQLKAHQEMKDLPVYELTIGKDGPKLQATNDHTGAGAGLRTRRGQDGQIEITGKAASIASFARALSNQLDRLVFDKTGLNAEYDFKVTFTAEPAPLPPDTAGPGNTPSRVDTEGPSIFGALQEQLGLKLKAEKGPVQVLIVDGAQRPSGN